MTLGQPDGWRRTALYGLAHFGKSLLWYGGELLFAYHLTEVAGLDSAAMGLVLGVGFLASAGLDLAIGRWLGPRMTQTRSAAALQALGSLAAAAAMVAFFVTPWLPPPLRIGWALASGLAFRFGFAVYDIPQNALMALAADDEAGRSRVAAARISASGMAMLAVAGAVGPLLAAQRVGAGATLLLSLAIAAALVAILTAFALRHTLADSGTAVRTPPIARSIAAGPALRALWPLFVMMAVMMLGPPLFQKLEPYFAARTLGSAAWGGAVILAAAGGVLCGQPLWVNFPVARQRLGLFLVGAVLQAFGAVLFFFAAPSSSISGLVVGAAFFGLGNGALGAAKWAAFSDGVSHFARGREGAYFAAFTATAKLSLAAGIVLVAATVAFAEADPSRLRWVMMAGPVAASALMALLAVVISRKAAALAKAI